MESLEMATLYETIENFQLTNYDDIYKVLGREYANNVRSKFDKTLISKVIDDVNYDNLLDSFKYIQTDGREGLPYRYYILKRFLDSKDVSVVEEKKNYNFPGYNNVRNFGDIKFKSSIQNLLNKLNEDEVALYRYTFGNYIAAGLLYIDYILEQQDVNCKKYLFNMFETVANKKMGKYDCIHIYGVPGSGMHILAKLLTSFVMTTTINNATDSLDNVHNSRVYHIKEPQGDSPRQLDYISKHSQCKPFILSTTTKDYGTDGINFLGSSTIPFIMNKVLDSEYIDYIRKDYMIKSKDIPLSPLHYVLYLGYVNSSEQNIYKYARNIIQELEQIISTNNINTKNLDKLLNFKYIEETTVCRIWSKSEEERIIKQLERKKLNEDAYELKYWYCNIPLDECKKLVLEFKDKYNKEASKLEEKECISLIQAKYKIHMNRTIHEM